ncbi:MAG: MBL fold metallo-hydrolase [Paramuribaculum sp.]|nr:MBL fold metallo-hydrolase [Paramuribaculum sp.]
MKLTILGSGTSTGVPQLRWDGDVCTSSDPRDKRLRTSALVEFKGKNILIDCGPDFRQQMLRLGSPALDALFVTHHHYDHLGGIDDLRPYCMDNPSGFPIFCREDVADIIHDRMSYCFGEKHYPGSPRLDLNVIDDKSFSPFAGIDITPLPVMHTPSLPITGFKIGPLCYITDCKIMPDKTLRLIEGCDTLVINALRHEAHPSHMNLADALDVITMTRPKRAILTHFAHQIGRYADVQPTLPANVTMAYDGLTIDI